MILAKAPMRVSFFGGGSDIPSHYNRWGGSTLSMAIDKYVYVTVSHTPMPWIKISYAKQEVVYEVKDIQNEIVRNALKYFDITSNIEINSFADIPTMGTGLGGSSSFTCALVAALAEYLDLRYDPFQIAESACQIEINMCGWNIGKQDQYASAFGGMNYIKYYPNGNITVQRIDYNSIDAYMTLIPTNITRHASEILDKIDMSNKSTLIMELAKQADQNSQSLPAFETYAAQLNEAWKMKKALQSGISNTEIDLMYEHCLTAGAKAAKLLGAGGGGFMLALTEDSQKLKSVFSDRVCLDVSIAQEGAKVVYRD